MVILEAARSTCWARMCPEVCLEATEGAALATALAHVVLVRSWRAINAARTARGWLVLAASAYCARGGVACFELGAPCSTFLADAISRQRWCSSLSPSREAAGDRQAAPIVVQGWRCLLPLRACTRGVRTALAVVMRTSSLGLPLSTSSACSMISAHTVCSRFCRLFFPLRCATSTVVLALAIRKLRGILCLPLRG